MGFSCSMTLPPAGRVLSRQHHALTQRTRVLIADQPIGRIAVLNEPGCPGFVADIDPGAVDREVGEEEHVTGPGRQRTCRRDSPVLAPGNVGFSLEITLRLRPRSHRSPVQGVPSTINSAREGKAKRREWSITTLRG